MGLCEVDGLLTTLTTERNHESVQIYLARRGDALVLDCTKKEMVNFDASNSPANSSRKHKIIESPGSPRFSRPCLTSPIDST